MHEGYLEIESEFYFKGLTLEKVSGIKVDPASSEQEEQEEVWDLIHNPQEEKKITFDL